MTREQRIAALRTAIAADLDEIRRLQLRIATIEDRSRGRLEGFMRLVCDEETTR